jgi:hypothetical protein
VAAVAAVGVRLPAGCPPAVVPLLVVAPLAAATLLPVACPRVGVLRAAGCPPAAAALLPVVAIRPRVACPPAAVAAGDRLRADSLLVVGRLLEVATRRGVEGIPRAGVIRRAATVLLLVGLRRVATVLLAGCRLVTARPPAGTALRPPAGTAAVLRLHPGG